MRVDVGLFVGATTATADAYLPVASEACGLKIYVNETFGSLRIDELGLMHRLFRTWAEKADAVGYRPRGSVSGLGPIAVHAEDMMVPVCLCLSELYDVPLHIVHVSRRSEIELMRRAKEKGFAGDVRGDAAPSFPVVGGRRAAGAAGRHAPQAGVAG